MSKRNDDSKPTPSVTSLLADAHKDGTLSVGAMAALDVVDLGAEIQAGLGVNLDDVTASEVLLVTMMPDDSASIASAGNTAAVRDGHNAVLEALGKSKQAGDVLVHTRYLNGHVLTPYAPLDQAVAMTSKNYDPSLGTPLYDQAVVVLGTVVAKAQQLAQAGIAVRTVTLIITDGGDYGSTRFRARDVRALVTDLLAQEHHVVAAMGISDGSTDFRAVFRDMGIPDRWIMTPGSSAAEIRRAFQVFSRSAASGAGAATFALGGFGN
ncbi:MAG: hypothetical protein KBG28_02875 [Kofleriaceae bacterium]|nr:hypothetical protein [Kofleriaceae bacterium]